MASDQEVRVASVPEVEGRAACGLGALDAFALAAVDQAACVLVAFAAFAPVAEEVRDREGQGGRVRLLEAYLAALLELMEVD